MKLLKIRISLILLILFLGISSQNSFQDKIIENENKLGEIKKKNEGWNFNI